MSDSEDKQSKAKERNESEEPVFIQKLKGRPRNLEELKKLYKKPRPLEDYYRKEEEEKPKKYLEDEITYTNFQIGLIIFLILSMAFVIYEYEYVHICALRFYANLGDMDAQHILGQRYYLGKGLARDKLQAFYWFKEAAKQGHGQASYNLGLAHIQGFHRLERKGEAHELIKHAASLGIKEAQHLLDTACAKGECDR